VAQVFAVSYRNETSANGYIYGQRRMEIWVVDVAGTTLTVSANSAGDVPARIQAEHEAVVDSVEFVVQD